MKNFYLPIVSLVLIIFLGFELTPAHADDANGISIQNILVQPYTIKVGDTFTVTATLVNNSTVPIVVEGGTCIPIIKDVPLFTLIFDNHTKIKYKYQTCAGVGLSQILDPGKKITSTSPDYTLNYTAIEYGTANVTVTFQYHVKNQDLTQPNIRQTISKSFQFLIHDVNETSVQKPPAYFASPLQQFKAGVAAKDVICKSGLQLIFKFEDRSPACVTQQTAQILVKRWWGMYVPAVTEHIPILSDSVKVPNTDFTINYNISGNNKLVDANMDSPSKSLILSLESTNNGTLIVSIPRALLDIKKNDRGTGEFYMLADGQETTFKEIHTTLIDRTFSIPFQNGTKNIEIITIELV